MKHETATRHGFKINHSDVHDIKIANSSPIRCSGSTKFKFTFQDRTILIYALISPDVHHQFYLGERDQKTLGMLPPNYPNCLLPAQPSMSAMVTNRPVLQRGTRLNSPGNFGPVRHGGTRLNLAGNFGPVPHGGTRLNLTGNFHPVHRNLQASAVITTSPTSVDEVTALISSTIDKYNDEGPAPQDPAPG